MALAWIYSKVAQEEIGITQWSSADHVAIDFNGHGEAWRGKALFAGYHGQVITATYRSDRGNYVEIQVDTNEGQFVIGFCHLQTIYTSVGFVSPTTQIGTMGDSGVSQGVHCHYYVTKNGLRIDPYRLLTNEVQQITDPTHIIDEDGFFTCNVDDLRVRETPSLIGEISGKCQKGKRYSYTKKTIADGYRWIYLNEYDCWTAWAKQDKSEQYGVIE